MTLEFWYGALRLVLGGGAVGLMALATGLTLELLLRRGRLQVGGQMPLNVGLMLFQTTVDRALTPVLFFWSAAALQAIGGGLVPIANPLLAFVVILVVDDFFRYWEHRAAHKWLWAFHSIHHSDPALNASTVVRVHWVEGQFAQLVHATPLMLLFSAPPEVYAALAIKASVVNTWLHLDVRLPLGPLSGVINGPQLHRIHHSCERRHHDRNFAVLFPIWDVVFGTYHAPQRNEFPETGVDGVNPPKSLLSLIIWPLGTGLNLAGRRRQLVGSGRLGTV